MTSNWFIALPVEANDLPAGLMGSIPAGLRRFAPADLHLTVAFLGGVGETAAQAAWQLTKGIHDGPFRPSTGSLSSFGNPRRPSAYGLELGPGGEAVRGFIRAWRNRLRRAAGVEEEQRDVRPHVTLARPPRSAGAALRKRADRWLARDTPAATVLELQEIALYTREPELRDRRFRRVEQRSLPAAAATDPGS